MKALLTTLVLLLAAFASVFPLLLCLRERGVLEPLLQIANRTRAFILVLLISATIFAGNKNVGSGVTNLLGGVRGALSSLMTGGGGTFTADELATGYALSSIGTNETHDFTMPTNAVGAERLAIRGAHRDWFWAQKGTLRARTDGTASYAGARSVTPLVFAVAQGSYGFLPEAYWSEYGVSRLWTAETEDGARVVTWEGALENRAADAPVTFQALLYPDGDISFRYSRFPSNAVAGITRSGASLVLDLPANATSALLRPIDGLSAGRGDFDDDGLADWDETVDEETDPRNADTDGDGLFDGEDASPLHCDADHDGVPDGADAADWLANPLRGNTVRGTNLVISVIRGMGLPDAPGQSALLDIGGLCVPLYTGASIPLFLPEGEYIDVSLHVCGRLPVRLALQQVAVNVPLYAEDPSGIFSRTQTRGANARLAIPTLELIPDAPPPEYCLHEGDTGRAFIPVMSPMDWSEAAPYAELYFFDVLDDGRLWLDAPEPDSPGNQAGGLVSFSTPWLTFAYLDVGAYIHWCEAAGYYCHACGVVHSDLHGCSHDSGCAAVRDPDAECDCAPLFVRVNLDDDDRNGVEDRDDVSVSGAEDDFLAFRVAGSGSCCCQERDPPAVRIAAVSAGLRLWDTGLNPIGVGDTVDDGVIMVEATAASSVCGGGYLTYEVLEGEDAVFRRITRRFTMAAVEILPDWNDDGLIDVNDLIIRDGFPLPGWNVLCRSRSYRLDIRNECPSDARFIVSTDADFPSVVYQGRTSNTVLRAAWPTNDFPFAERNVTRYLHLDASAPGLALLSCALATPEGEPLTSDSLQIRALDGDPGHRYVEKNGADVTWDFPGVPCSVGMEAQDTEGGDDWSALDGTPPAFSPNRPVGAYKVAAHFADIWENNAFPASRTGVVEVVDLCITAAQTNTFVGNLRYNTFRPSPESDRLTTEWTLEPQLPEGARLGLGNTTGFTVTGAGSVSFRPGSVATNYTLHARHAVLTNIHDSVRVRVGDFRLVPDYDFDGEIGETDFADAATNRTMRIWLNNDDDDQSPEDILPWSDAGDDERGYEVPEFGSWYGDFGDWSVNGNRDRLDWFPVWLDLAAPLDSCPFSQGYTYRLRQGNEAVNVIFTSLTRRNADSYQTEDPPCAGSGFALPVTNATVAAVSSDGLPVPSDFLSLAVTNADMGVILVEGRALSANPLYLEILDADDELIARKRLHLSVTSVEDMFRFVNLRSVTSGSSSPSTRTNEPPNRPYISNGKNVFFLHGFRVGANDSRGWGSEFFKKLLRSGSRADFWMVTWNSDPTDGIDYYWAANNAFLTASNLAAVVNSVPGEKVVMAHSLGNMVVSSAFVDHGMVADKYFALNAAVASEAFDSTLFNTSTNNPLVHTEWYDFLPRTWSSCWNELFHVEDDRRKLTWKDRFADIGEHTTMYNYWSSGDEVLEIGPPGMNAIEYMTAGNVWTERTPFVWHKQELFKGRSPVYGTGWAGWGFQYDIPDPFSANEEPYAVLRRKTYFRHYPWRMFRSTIRRAFQNEIIVKGIPALSAPVGRTELPTRIVRENFDMNSMKPDDDPWCRNHRTYGERWLHADIHDVGYFYTHELFKSFVEKGDLR